MFSAMFILLLCCSCLSTLLLAENHKDQPLFGWEGDNNWWKIHSTTKEPWILKKYTFSPDYKYLPKKDDDHSGTYLAVLLLIFFSLVVFFGYLRCMYEERCRGALIFTLYDSSEIRNQGSLSSATESSVTNERENVILEFSNPANDSISISSAIDIPPRYDDVVQSDLSGQRDFPEIRIEHETPPPSYDYDETLRY